MFVRGWWTIKIDGRITEKERWEFVRNDHRAASDEMGFLFLIAIFTRNVLRLEFKNSCLLSSIYQVRKLIVNLALLPSKRRYVWFLLKWNYIARFYDVGMHLRGNITSKYILSFKISSFHIFHPLNIKNSLLFYSYSYICWISH